MYVNGRPIRVDKKNLALNKREKSNWLVHILFIRQDFTECLKYLDLLIQEDLDQGNSQYGEKSEYALFLKALILRIKGDIHQSLDLFKKCHLLNPNNTDYLKQFGRSLYLLGKHSQAIEMFDECLELDNEDWEIYFYKGLSSKYMRKYDEAIVNFKKANDIYPNENTFLELGRVYQLTQSFSDALEIYAEGLNSYPENSELLTTIGLLYIRLGQNN